MDAGIVAVAATAPSMRIAKARCLDIVIGVPSVGRHMKKGRPWAAQSRYVKVGRSALQFEDHDAGAGLVVVGRERDVLAVGRDRGAEELRGRPCRSAAR